MSQENDPLKISAAAKVAGGISSITSALSHSFSEMGLIRTARALLRVNKEKGFDCPGCAWPDPHTHRSTAEFCENGAKAVAEEATTKRVTPQFFATHSIPKLALQTDYEIGKHGRLTAPVVKRAGSESYEEISWESAFRLIAEELNKISPDEAAFYTSGRTSNEAAFLYQLFVRLYGTNNLPDCSNMCHESSGVALIETIGVGKGTVTLEDFEKADCILVIGQNPGTNHPRMLTALEKAARNGCKIISINPLREAGTTAFIHPQEVGAFFGKGTPLATQFLPVRTNGDVALLQGIMKEMLESGSERFAHPFIKEKTLGYEEFATHIRGANWETIIEASGISRDLIAEAARTILSSKRMIACWAMGLTQHKNAVANIQEVVNLLLLGGHFGRPGAGACPVRGHSNVQGDRTMGICEHMPEAFFEALGKEFNFQPPRKTGFDTVATIKAMHAGAVKVFFGMGGNFLSASPDTKHVGEALKKCRLTVHVSTKLNRSHLVTGELALILPCLGRTEVDLQKSGEQFVTVENSMSVVHSSRGQLKPEGALLSEVAIVAGIAEEVFRNSKEKHGKVKWIELRDDYSLIRGHIERVIPGFDNFNARVTNGPGFYLPNPVRESASFPTRSGKAHFTVHAIPENKLPEGRFLLMTIRSHDQFNTTIYGLDDRYRGIRNGRQVVFMNPDDMIEAGFSQGDSADITSYFGRETRVARAFRVVPYEIPKKCLAAYFPEANVLVPIESVAERSNTPAYKSIEVSLERAR